jgi:hypothetical protein
MKKRFLEIGIFWVFRAIIAGVLYSTAAFFTKEGLEKWKSKCRNYFRF